MPVCGDIAVMLKRAPPGNVVPTSGPAPKTRTLSGESGLVCGRTWSCSHFTFSPRPPRKVRATPSSIGWRPMAPLVRSTRSTRPPKLCMAGRSWGAVRQIHGAPRSRVSRPWTGDVARKRSCRAAPHAGRIAVAEIADERQSRHRIEEHTPERAGVGTSRAQDAGIHIQANATGDLVAAQRANGTGRHARNICALPAHLGTVDAAGLDLRHTNARGGGSEPPVVARDTRNFTRPATAAARFIRDNLHHSLVRRPRSVRKRAYDTTNMAWAPS